MTPEEKALIEAVRNDPKIGRGSCASIDECWDDEDILKVIQVDQVTTADKLLDILYSLENIFRDRADDALTAGGGKPIWGQVEREKGEA